MGVIRRCFNNIKASSFVNLYKALVRNHLEYGVQIWFPFKMKHIEQIEAVQRRATHLIPNLKHMSYENRLKKLSLPTLTYRKIRGDMIQVFKILHGYCDIEPSKLLKLKRDLNIRTTGCNHPYSVFQEFCHHNSRKFFFSNRITHHWNN